TGVPWDTVLTGAGFQVETASDGQAALERAWTHDPTVVVLDPRLPDCDGRSVAAALRAVFGAHLPILLVDSTPSAAEMAWRIEACQLLPAECEPAALLAALQQALRGEEASVEAVIGRLADEWMAAMVHRDQRRLAQLVAEECR